MGIFARFLAWFDLADVTWQKPEFLKIAFVAGGGVFLIFALALVIYQTRFSRFRSPSLRRFHRSPNVWMWWAGACVLGLTIVAGGVVFVDPVKKTVVLEPEYEGGCFGIGLDVSLSMLAPVEEGATESRLQNSMRLIEEFVRSLPQEDRLAFAIFAKDQKLFRPAWTTDRERVFYRQLRAITPHYVRSFGRSGSNIAAVFQVWSLSLPKDAKCQPFVLVFTDGEPEGEEDFLKAQLLASLEAVSKSSVKVVPFIVVIGDPHQERLRIPEYNDTGQLMGHETDDKGRFIRTKPDIAYLDLIASRFRAELVFAARGEDLQKKIARAVTKERHVVREKKIERFESVSQKFIAAYLIGLFFFSLLLVL